MIEALKLFGFASLSLTAEDLTEPGQVIQLGYPPQRIDLLTSADGVEFSQCYEDRLTVDLGDVWVAFIDIENLKRNKRATGRTQDLADLEALQ